MRHIGNMRVLAFLDDTYHLLAMPFGYASYLVHRLRRRPYFGVWLASAQGNPGRRRYMRLAVDHLVDARRADGNGSDNGVRILEIGAYAGGSAITWGRALQAHDLADRLVVSVDPWNSYLDLSANSRLLYRIMDRNLAKGKVLALFIRNLRAAGLSHLCREIRGRSDEMLPLIRDAQFDLIYVDADHRAEAVFSDLTNADRLLKDGGILCGDDLELQLGDLGRAGDGDIPATDVAMDPATHRIYHPGVAVAVDRFFGRRITCYDGFWVVRKRGADFEDVVLPV